MAQVRSRFIALAAIAVALLVVVAGGARGFAQDDGTPMATPDGGMMAMEPIQNHIHAGTCDTLGEVVVPLSNAEFRNMGGGMMEGMGTPMADMGTPMAGGMMMGASTWIPVAAATTTVELTLDEILAAEHSINFPDPADPSDPDLYLACGNIGGAPDAEGNLFVGLAEDNDSGHYGVAWLLDNGTGTTVTVFLAAEGMMGEDMADDMEDMTTPMADDDEMGTPEN